MKSLLIFVIYSPSTNTTTKLDKRHRMQYKYSSAFSFQLEFVFSIQLKYLMQVHYC